VPFEAGAKEIYGFRKNQKVSGGGGGKNHRRTITWNQIAMVATRAWKFLRKEKEVAKNPRRTGGLKMEQRDLSPELGDLGDTTKQGGRKKDKVFGRRPSSEVGHHLECGTRGIKGGNIGGRKENPGQRHVCHAPPSVKLQLNYNQMTQRRKVNIQNRKTAERVGLLP